MRVLAFDIGIKNLAFCVLEEKHVIALENCNILEPVEAVLCTQCKARAAVFVENTVYCKRHMPKTHKILPELMGKKLPPNKVLIIGISSLDVLMFFLKINPHLRIRI